MFQVVHHEHMQALFDIATFARTPDEVLQPPDPSAPLSAQKEDIPPQKEASEIDERGKEEISSASKDIESVDKEVNGRFWKEFPNADHSTYFSLLFLRYD